MLFLVATPIGNLGDISARALEVLRSVNVIYAEDTRVTRRLLSAFDLHTPLKRFDDATTARKIPEILARLARAEDVALVSDAGMPSISDPGTPLVAAARAANHEVTVIPGASAAVTALAASGLPSHAYYFGGFLPRKPGKREKLLAQLAPLNATLIFYESPQRVVKTLSHLADFFPGRRAAFARELTKKFEELRPGPLPDLAVELARRPAVKGEFVLLIAPAARKAPPN
jgi:16S rRNA (cytidine1402-2'-O)-methyltransferase